MKAIALSENRTIELQEHPVPDTRPGEVLLRSEYCGICGTDLHAPDLDLFLPPVIMGHEFSAEVVAVGPEVTGWSPGMRVTVNPNGNICGTCPQCRTGRYNLCPVATQVMSLGVCRDGGMAEYAAVPLSTCTRCPTASTACAVRGPSRSRSPSARSPARVSGSVTTSP